MKRIFISCIMLIAAAAVTAGLAGCDEEKSDNNMLAIILAGSRIIPECGSTWTVLTPADGSDHVSTDTNIVLQRNTDLDPTPDVNDEVTLIRPDGSTLTFNMGNSEFNITGDTVTINPAGSLPYYTAYSGITITSIEAAGGEDLASDRCRISDYNFRTDTH